MPDRLVPRLADSFVCFSTVSIPITNSNTNPRTLTTLTLTIPTITHGVYKEIFRRFESQVNHRVCGTNNMLYDFFLMTKLTLILTVKQPHHAKPESKRLL